MGGYFGLIAIAKPPPSALIAALALLEHPKGLAEKAAFEEQLAKLKSMFQPH